MIILQYFQFLQSSSRRQSLVKASQLSRVTEDVMLWSCGCFSCLWSYVMRQMSVFL